jgi:hypothetical protein
MVRAYVIPALGGNAIILPSLSQLVLLLLLFLLRIRTQPHLGCCLAAATAAASLCYCHGINRPIVPGEINGAYHAWLITNIVKSREL